MSELDRENNRQALNGIKRVFAVLALLCSVLLVGIVGVAVYRALGYGTKIPQAPDVGSMVSIETTAKAVTLSEKLPANSLADNMWGPLPVVTDKDVKEVKHFGVKGLYAGECKNIDHIIDICDNSELNTIVIDLKTEVQVCFNTTNETAKSIGYVYASYDLDKVVQTAHEHGIRVIGRIVSFNDSRAANKFPERAIKDKDGSLLHFKSESSRAFLDPYNKDNWEYLISLADEAVGHGIDEIQFDYVRFPVGKTTEGTDPYFGEEGSVPTKADSINRFLQTAKHRLSYGKGIPVGADIFGIVMTSSLDAKNIGQDFDSIGLTGIDSVAPMLYPSHYALGTMIGNMTFEYPDKEPYMLLYKVLEKKRDVYTSKDFTYLRPYLQGFTATYIGEGNYMKYGYNQINSQISAVKESGIDEFIIWDPTFNYPSGTYSGQISPDAQ